MNGLYFGYSDSYTGHKERKITYGWFFMSFEAFKKEKQVWDVEKIILEYQ